MKRAVIFANGRLEKPPLFNNLIHPSDVIIAADGGYRNCISIGIQPDVIIGDQDSLLTEEIENARQKGIEVIQHPTHKDETDLELAMQLAVARGMEELLILAALGDRWDMTVANILLLAHPNFSQLKMRLVDGHQEFLILRAGGTLEFIERTHEILSLIPLNGDASGITTSGLEYPLKDESLKFGSPRGVSNVILDEHAKVSLRKGLLLCILKKDGMDIQIGEEKSI